MGSSSVIAPTSARSIQRSLLTWYDENKRDLPWRRRAGDPYAQWVAEIMLQQTRVETVMPYYLRFMDRFPDVEKLARARHESVLKHWEGLGYYRRALLLHEGAKQVRA
ncbi:MAG: A/G-specific adenine glycosylase, partial [Phycisphaerae bacterium]